MRERLGGLLGAGVGGGGAPHPPQDVGGRVLLDGGDVQPLRPFHAVRLGDVPGVQVALHAAQGRLELLGEGGFHHGEIAADVEDVAHRFVVDRADVHAGTAGSARPDRLGGDEVHQVGVHGVGVVHVVALVDLEGGGAEQLAGVVGGADLLAAVAHDAGVAVEHLLPAEVLELCRAELLDGLVLDVDIAQLADGFARRLEGIVERGEEHVDVLGEWEVGQEDQDGAEVDPEGDVLAGVDGGGTHAGPQACHRAGEGLPLVQPGGSGEMEG